MNKVLEVININKSLSKTKVLDNINFSVLEWELYGFLWPNWAWKTTTMKTIMGLITQDSWEIKIFSKNDMNFTYRDSFFKQNESYFIINATFDLSKKIEKYSSDVDNIKFREEVQPAWNSCWSFFKNP